MNENKQKLIAFLENNGAWISDDKLNYSVSGRGIVFYIQMLEDAFFVLSVTNAFRWEDRLAYTDVDEWLYERVTWDHMNEIAQVV
jgi:hypothetical protein